MRFHNLLYFTDYIKTKSKKSGLKTVPTACNFNRDGLLVAAACQDGSIQMWDHRYALFVSLSTKIFPRLGLIFAAPTTVFRLLLRRSWLSKWLLGLHLDRPPGRLPATKFPPLDKLSIFFVFSRLSMCTKL